MFATRLELATLIKCHPPIGWERERNKKLIWNMIQARDEKNANGQTKAKAEVEANASAKPNKLMRFAKYNSLKVPMDCSNLINPSRPTQFHLVDGIFDYRQSKDIQRIDWVRKKGNGT